MPSPTRFGDLNDGAYGNLIYDLTRGKVTAADRCHLDPDINPNRLLRTAGWRGAFGQVSAAQGHLANQRIQPGDLFIFWGLFRSAEHDSRWKFVGRPEHRIWGWLQIAEIIELGPDGSHAVVERPWLSDHPHTRPGWGDRNVLYIASQELVLGSHVLSLPGSGTLNAGYRLSVVEAKPSTWRVPDWLNPRRGGCGMTYHPLQRWGDHGTLQSAARGQEFVAVPRRRDDTFEWISAVLQETLK
jgi:hypothetical protein